ncbi:formate dehydrogenase subunit alpha [Noviherbaspirillum sp. Root189]|uniref:formate dehydrogenase subunit alpha n=1 Tax=Noviherbaspirillum sp. Root189 TaxID=1736487 RepID=UPI00070BB0C0|nr:formate dehydrogenase subunit alpha [Noviherbaspirillum sp. Root189]KRB70549.1 formate dehydrogenase [Noviherbaspirillum sp. Root189]
MNAITRRELGLLPAATVRFTLNGKVISARENETILSVAAHHAIKIPHLCYMDGLDTAGNCRACVVEIAGERVLAPSCCRYPREGMEIVTDSERALKAQRMVLELLQSDMPATEYTRQNELTQWIRRLGIGPPRFAPRLQVKADLSHPAIAVNLDACIQCTRCLRACREEQVNDVIGLAFRGDHAQIVFDMNDPMGGSTCVACGECVQACPTGALTSAGGAALIEPEKKVDSLCPYCGVGCQVSYGIKDNKILYAEGRDGPANHKRLCVKGRYGFDYAHNRQRLTKPLVRRAGVSKLAGIEIDPADAMGLFREASWEEALDLTGRQLMHIRETAGKRALAGFGSAKGSNEEAYLFQKLVRTGFGSNNVDHCTRLCHASSVAALLEGIGSGGVSNPVMDVSKADLVLLIGANPTTNHPVAATWIKNAVRNGTRLIIADPRRSDLARLAYRHLQFAPDTDVALLNAMMHVIVHEDLVNRDFITRRTVDYDALVQNVETYSPERMAPICGIDAGTIREVARLYATSPHSMILWGMGISQHVHGTDNARCLIALALMTGQIGRPGTGLHPLRGQNNVQGASDAGLIPMMYPDYQRVDDPVVRAKFEQLWGMPLDPRPGRTVVEIIHAIKAGEIRGMYIMGENPAMSDPDASRAREALAALDHLVVQDIFLTETACLADVVLPASAFLEKTGTFTNTDRVVQLGRPAVDTPGDARQDLWIIRQIAARMGLNWHYGDASAVSDVFNEMRSCMPSIAGITWERLQAQHAATYPCLNEDDPGEPVVFTDTFPTPTGRARFVPADIIPAAERPDAQYPVVLITGRQLEHWHTGSMTRRAAVLDAIEPDPVALVHPLDLAELGSKPGEVITLESRRGKVSLFARADDSSPRGTVFVPFCYFEAAINKLTNPVLDPFGKIPEFKYCAVRLQQGGDDPKQIGYGGDLAKEQTQTVPEQR